MKNIFITGSRSGIIGEVIDKIKDRYNLYLSVHTNSELKYMKNKYKKYNNIKCIKLDLLNDKDLKIINNLKIDILICNAAIMESGSLIDMPFESIRENFEVNFFKNIGLIKSVILNNNAVKVIVISSLGGKIPMPFCGAYSSSKAALSKMMEALSIEMKLSNKKVIISIIESGLYKTGFNEYGFNKKYEFMDKNWNLKLIKILESLLYILEKQNYKTITKKILIAIYSKKPKLHYKTPVFQSLFVKLYNFFS